MRLKQEDCRTFVRARSRTLTTLATLAVAIGGLTTTAWAGSVTIVPPSLAVGQTYRLVFVTAETYTATDTNINDYNTAVLNDANNNPLLQGLNTTWNAIASTQSVAAITNVGQDAGVPIYNLGGQFVAADATTTLPSGLFSGNTLANPIFFDENGNSSASPVWTGSFSNGLNVPGCVGLGCATPIVGMANSSSSFWITETTAGSANTAALYALSGVLTVAAPEPATNGMLALGLVTLCLAARRKQRTAQVSSSKA